MDNKFKIGQKVFDLSLQTIGIVHSINGSELRGEFNNIFYYYDKNGKSWYRNNAYIIPVNNLIKYLYE